MNHGASGRTTSMAAVWLAELRPISTGLTPHDSRINDSSGQVSPRVIATTDMEATTMAMLRRRSAALRVNAVTATKGASAQGAGLRPLKMAWPALSQCTSTRSSPAASSHLS